MSQDIKHYDLLNKEANKEHKEYLKKLQEQMYLTEPGVNHRVVEEELRRYFRELRNNPNKKSEKIQSSEFAWGRLTGTWQERGSKNNSGRTHLVDLASDLKTLYLASSGGNIWKGTIEGKNWTCLNNTYQFQNINNLFIQKLNNIDRIIVSENKNIYYSDNNGESFTEVVNFGTVKTIDIWGDKNYSNLYLQKLDTLFEINNNNSFTYLAQSDFIESMLNENHDIKMTGMFYQDKPVIYYATKISNSNRMILKYDNSKNRINYMGEVETDMFMRNSFEVSKLNPNLLWLGGVNTYYSTDGGLLGWTLVNKWDEYYKDVVNKLHADIPAINTFKIGDNAELIFVNTDGGTYVSTGAPNIFKKYFFEWIECFSNIFYIYLRWS